MRFSLITKCCAALLLLLLTTNFPPIASDSANPISNINMSINSMLLCHCEFGWLFNLDSFIGRLIVKLRKKFDILVHFDSESDCAVNCAIRYSTNLDIVHNHTPTKLCLKVPRTITLLNYATINMVGISNYERPKAYAMAHLILLANPWTYERYSKINFNILSIDIIYIFSPKIKRFRTPRLDMADKRAFSANPNSSFWTMKNLDRGGGINIIEERKKTIHYYRICYYCGNQTKALFEQWKAPVNNLTNLDIEKLIKLSTNHFKNFFNHTFRVGFLSSFSFHVINGTKGYNDFGRQNYRCDPCGGPEGRLMVELANRFNLQFYLYPIALNTKVTDYDVIKEIQENQLDWAIGGLTTTKERRAVVDFTNTLNNDPYTFIYYLTDDNWERAALIIKPFTKWVWFVIGVSIVIMWIFAKFYIEMPSSSNMQKPFVNIMRIILGQPITGIITISMRLKLAIWIIVSMILTTMYSTRIASMAIIPEPTQSLTLDTAINNNYVFLLSKVDSFMMKSMIDISEDSKLMKILTESRNDLPFCDAINYIIRQSAIILDEQTVLWDNYMKMCYGNMSEMNKKRIYIQQNEIFSSYHAWPIKYNTPYLRSFNNFIGLVIQSGIYYKWMDDALRLIQMERSDIAHRYKYYKDFTIGFQLKDVLGAFILFITGMVISTACFALEVISKRDKCKSLKIFRNYNLHNTKITKRHMFDYYGNSS